MSQITYTVLVSPTGTGPFRARMLKPLDVASLWVGGSANWVFTSLHDGARASFRPLSPSDEAGTLLIGLAVHVLKDEETTQQWDARVRVVGPDAPVDSSEDRDLIESARGTVKGRVRLSILGDEIENRPVLPDTLMELEGLVDVEIMRSVSVAGSNGGQSGE